MNKIGSKIILLFSLALLLAGSATRAAATGTETVNTLDFFVSKHLDKSLNGSHHMGETVAGQSVYMTKWSPGSFELYEWDDQNIYLREDHSANPGYMFSNGVWLKRQMNVGEVISNPGNYYQGFDANCQSTTTLPFAFRTTLESHLPNYDAGGDLGIQDVIVVKYEYGADRYEKMYYSREWGWIKWEYIATADNQVVMTATFNRIQSTPIRPERTAGCYARLRPKAQDAYCVSSNMPGNMLTGAGQRVTFTLQNTGTTAWTKTNDYKLGYVDRTWGLGRINLPDGFSVNPLDTYSFSIDLTAPAVPGTYDGRWKMLQEMVAWFGQSCGPSSVTVASPAPVGVLRDAQCLSHNIPTAMTAGENRTVSVTMKNTGTAAWTLANDYKLGYVDRTWGMGRVNFPDGVSVGPNETYTFNFQMTAPSSPGTYNGQWKMLQEMVAWFGQGCGPTSVAVSSPAPVGILRDAQCLSHDIPAAMTTGENRTVSVTMKNTGSATWTEANSFRLGFVNTLWRVGRALLPAGTSVGPGETFTFTFPITAPSTPGSYNSQWKMLQEMVAWFGQGCGPANVAVSSPPALPLRDAQCLSHTIPAAMSPGETRTVSVTMKNTGSATWTEANSYRLGFVNTLWRVGRALLPVGVSIVPGGTYTFNFSITAPSTPGTYNSQWRMLQEMVAWFGQGCGPSSVNVQ